MGFRSVFISEHVDGSFADWFVEKWTPSVHFANRNQLPISAKIEAKLYSHWDELHSDIQKAFSWEENDELVMVWFHECTGVTRVQIRKNEIFFNEPESWEDVKQPSHHYCYGCSDAQEAYEQGGHTLILNGSEQALWRQRS